MEIRNASNLPPQTPMLDALVQTPTLDQRARRQAGAASEGSGGDRVEISEAARQAVLIGQLARRVLELPEAVSPDRVAAGQAALARGQLDSAEAARAAASAMIAGA